MTDPQEPGTPRDPDSRADELACLEAQEREFLRADEGLDPADRERVDRLGGALRREILGDPGPEVRSARRNVVAIAVPALAAAALLILLLVPRGRGPGRETPVLRGEPAAAIAPLDAVVKDEGGTAIVRFRWPGQDDADSYTVLVLDADRATVARIEAGATPAAEWEIPAALRESPLEWVVIARREGREVRRSAVEPLEVGARPEEGGSGGEAGP